MSAFRILNLHQVFDGWFDQLKDQQAKRRIRVRIDRVEDGNFGDTEPVSEKGI